MYCFSEMAQEAVQCLREGNKQGFTAYVSDMYAHQLSKREVDRFLKEAGIDDVESSTISLHDSVEALA